MANRQMAFQWTALKLSEVMEALNKFVQLAGVDNELRMLEMAMEKCKLEEKARKDFRIALDVARLLMKDGRPVPEVRKIIAWRTADVTSGYTLQVEYFGGVVSPVSSVSKA